MAYSKSILSTQCSLQIMAGDLCKRNRFKFIQDPGSCLSLVQVGKLSPLYSQLFLGLFPASKGAASIAQTRKSSLDSSDIRTQRRRTELPIQWGWIIAESLLPVLERCFQNKWGKLLFKKKKRKPEFIIQCRTFYLPVQIWAKNHTIYKTQFFMSSIKAMAAQMRRLFCFV